jgi:hypothetical protein
MLYTFIIYNNCFFIALCCWCLSFGLLFAILLLFSWRFCSVLCVHFFDFICPFREFCKCLCVCVYIYICVCVYIYVCIYMCVCIYVCVCVCVSDTPLLLTSINASDATFHVNPLRNMQKVGFVIA